ncbi:hypothetical protein PoB_003940900 [Plakobranchus ocellatus]|uniref:Uncharacterized protein n=1 Tax=Plakobranchus ocellatus TaxID=259542 RepID=A0AAV4AYR2_9GAST|nr:hypothetical protein PoB_003940900 [Plakobranchus ocellatus]
MKKSARCNDMASLGLSRKRSHDDLDDGDECLPISKRINSLHIEGQSALKLQDGHALALVENQCDTYPGTSSVYHDDQSGEFIQGGPDDQTTSGLQLRQLPVVRLPRIDEQENRFDGLIHQLPCPSHVSTSASFQDPIDMSQASYNSGQLQTIEQNGFLQSNPGLLTNHTTSHAHFPFLHSQDNANLLPQRHLLQNRYGKNGLSSMGVPHHEQAAFSNPQLSNTVDSMESQQNFTYPHSVGAAPSHQLNQQQCINETVTNYSEPEMRSHSGCEPSLSQEQSSSDHIADFEREQLPSGIYEPELGVAENPFYFSVNQMLYEAHLSRVRRLNQFPDG